MDRSRGDRAWSIAVVIACLGMVTVNALANTLPMFGRTTGAVSQEYPNLFTPAPYTFSVWGLIYLLLAGFAVYQLLVRAASSPRVAAARPWFVLSCALNAGWLVAWHALAIAVSEVLMVGLLLTLIALYLQIDAWRARPSRPAERWLLDLPFSVYLGWISVATIANTAVFLVSLGFDAGDAAVPVTVVMVAAATALGILGVSTRRDWGYALVIAWGLGGVMAARLAEDGDWEAISVVALFAVAVLAASAVYAVRPGRSSLLG